VEGKQVSGLQYLYSAGTGMLDFDGTWLKSKALKSAGVAVGQDVLEQGWFDGMNNIDLKSVVVSGLSAGLSTKIMGIPSKNAVPKMYRFMTEQVVDWTFDTAGQTINSGLKK
jgi:hypothetical protein